MNAPTPPPVLRPEIADPGRIRLGEACRRLPPVVRPEIADKGRIRTGEACKLSRAG